jgi:hypothetical protein
MAVIWGDLYEKDAEKINDNGSGRPSFGKIYFERIMKQLNKSIMIRSHQPTAPEKMFENKCLTIFTAKAYGNTIKRQIATIDSSKKEFFMEDIEITEI